MATDPSDAVYEWATRGAWVDLAAPGCEYGADMCGTSYAPPVVAGAVGVLLAADPRATPAQALAALRATAAPVAGIGGGRIDLPAAAAALGVAPSQPSAPEPSASGAAVIHGMLRTRLTTPLSLRGGSVRIVLTRQDALRCSMTLRSAKETIVSWVGSPDIVALSATVAGGKYTLVATCTDGKSRPYTLSLVTNATQRAS
jgi:Subtilase family